jgi:hypothetical protein
MVAVGANKATPIAPLETSSIKSSTNVLDEMYRQLGMTLGAASVSGYNLGATDVDSSEELADVWGLEEILADLD